MRSPGPSSDADSAATADYISAIARELRTLAAKSNLGFLAYLLAMVEDDAQETPRRLADARETAER